LLFKSDLCGWNGRRALWPASPFGKCCLPPGQWQVYDIIFIAPKFATDGTLKSPAYATVFLNGLLIQNHQSFMGTTGWKILAQYTPHASTGPIELQYHGNPIRFRNVWVRPLKNEDEQ
jgi:hypothetical protein